VHEGFYNLKEYTVHGTRMAVEAYNYIRFHIAVRTQNFPSRVSYLHARRYMGQGKSNENLVYLLLRNE